MKLRCPICHSSNSLDAYGEDAAAKECLTLLCKNVVLLWPLVSYLSLFRPARRDLAWSRTLRLAGEVLAIDAEPRQLSAALERTVEAMRIKRDRGEIKPLKDHRYLESVLESVKAEGVISAPSPGTISPRETVPKHDAALAEWAGDDALRQVVAQGLLLLLARRLGNAPAPDTIARTATIWLRELQKSGVGSHETERVQRAFSGLISHARDWWPGPEKLTAELPRRKEQAMLYGAGPGEDDRAAAQSGLEEMKRAVAGKMAKGVKHARNS